MGTMLRYGIAILVLGVAGCSEVPGPALLSSRDSATKIRAMKATSRQRQQDARTLQLLIDDLDSSDAAVRLSAIKTLQAITGRTLDYDWTIDPEQRRPAVQRWQAWLDEKGSKAGPASRPAKTAKGS